MQSFHQKKPEQTVILRHRRENLKKCSLSGLEKHPNFKFFTYPKDELPKLDGYILLTLGAEELSEKDTNFPIFLLDGTWKLADKMLNKVFNCNQLICRSIPKGWKTAYPRRQQDCSDPDQGLASVEALYAAYYTLGWDTDGILDHYYWKEDFLKNNLL